MVMTPFFKTRSSEENWTIKYKAFDVLASVQLEEIFYIAIIS